MSDIPIARVDGYGRQDGPQVTFELTLARCLCAHHGEVFRAGWPAGYPIFIVEAFKAVAGSDHFVEEWIQIPGKEDVDKIHQALEMKPLCCRLEPKELLRIYEECKIGKRKRCNGCRQCRNGTPYRTVNRLFGHLCFHCVIFRVVPHGEN